MTCEGCSSPYGGIYIAGCRPCDLRFAAKSQAFMESLRRNNLTSEYRAMLRPLGEDIVATHKEVRAMAKTLRMGANP